MQTQRAWLTAVSVFFVAAACSDASPVTGLAPQAARFELVGTATVASECQAKIDALIALTQTTPITSKNAERDRAGLLKILTDANALLSVGKNADAAKKLTDFIVKVEQLEAAGRLDAVSAEPLIAGANDAIACINAIGA